VLSDEDQPVRNCTVSIYDFDGHLVDQRPVDERGEADFPNLAYQNYTYLVDWAGTTPPGPTRVAAGFINPTSGLVADVTVRSRVYAVAIAATDFWGNPLRGAQVTVRPVQSVTAKSLVTDNNGSCSLFLSTGNYTVDMSAGGYVGSEVVDVRSSSAVDVRGTINPVVYATIALSSSGWVALGIVWRWKTRGLSYEELKVKEMIAKLDDLYEAGEVEYPLYRRLKEEYSSQLRQVRTR